MHSLAEIPPASFALMILISASLFAFFWMLDARMHAKLVKVDITDKELQTHRIILLTSVLMEGCLVLMFWFHWLILPLFIACFFTRTAHEFIDELHWHTDRCTMQESLIHVGMWLSILVNTATMFMWGFFTQYSGLETLPIGYIIWAVLVGLIITFIGYKEWGR